MPKTRINTNEIQELLTRSVDAIYPSKKDLEKALRSGPPLRVYLGVDPTGPHLHLGHLTNLLLLRRFQKLGHKVFFLIGDFTGRVGDPTDKMAPRQSLTEKQVEENMRTFEEQASRAISFSGKNKVEIRFNSEWYKEMKLEKFIKDLLGYFSVQNMLERKELRRRIKTGHIIHLQEFIYPLLQGYDGVKLDVDVEVGGNDQTFNMSVGRALRKAYSERKDKLKITKGEKFFVATTLLVNPKTGKKIMNKSEGGLINLDDPPDEIFGKIMALGDETMFPVAEHSSEMPMAEIQKLRNAVNERTLNPRDAKLRIASAVVATICGAKAAKAAETKFVTLFSKKDTTIQMPSLKISGNTITPAALVLQSGVAKSMSEARRLITQGGVEINGERVKNPKTQLLLEGGETIKIGKHRFFRVTTR